MYQRGGGYAGYGGGSQYNRQFQSRPTYGRQPEPQFQPNSAHFQPGPAEYDYDWQHQPQPSRATWEAKERHAQMLQNTIEQLREETSRLREDMRALESAKDREVADMQEELRRESSRLHDVHSKLSERERELQQTRDTDQLKNDKIRDYQEQLEHQKKATENEKRRFEEEMDNLRRQHAREIESGRKEAEARLETEHRNLTQRDEHLTKLRQEVSNLETRLRASVTELEAEKSAAKSQIETLRTEVNRKEELRVMFEKETNLKQERVEEAHKLTRTLQVTLNEKEKDLTKLRSDLLQANQRIEETERSLKTATDMSSSERDRAEKITREYREITEMIGASESVSSSYMATRIVREKLSEHSETVHNLAKTKAELEEERAKTRSLELEKEELQREKETAESGIKLRDADLAAVREDLLNSTRELRGLILANEHITSEKHRSDEITEDLTKQVETARERIEELEKGKLDTARVETEALRRWEKDRAELEKRITDQNTAWESKHEFEIGELRRSIDRQQQELRDKGEWVDMCKEIGRLLGVDIRQNSPQSANGLYRAVEALEDDLRKVKREYEAVKFDLEETRKHAHGHTAPPHKFHTTPPTYHNMDIVPSTSYTQTGKTTEIEYLKTELRRSTEAMARAKKKFDDLKETIAKALGFRNRAKKVDATTLLARINQIMTNAPMDERFDSLFIAPSKVKASKTSSKDPKDKLLEKLQKKLRQALETIESQDMWINVLQAKVKGRETTNELQGENYQLRETLENVRSHLLHESSDDIMRTAPRVY